MFVCCFVTWEMGCCCFQNDSENCCYRFGTDIQKHTHATHVSFASTHFFNIVVCASVEEVDCTAGVTAIPWRLGHQCSTAEPQQRCNVSSTKLMFLILCPIPFFLLITFIMTPLPLSRRSLIWRWPSSYETEFKSIGVESRRYWRLVRAFLLWRRHTYICIRWQKLKSKCSHRNH